MQSTLCPLATLTTVSFSAISSSRTLKPIPRRKNHSLSCSSPDSNPRPEDDTELEMEMECPDPFEGKKKMLTTLQKHVSFFDRNKDGTIYPWETTQGFMALGYNPFLSFSFALTANFWLSFSTRPWRLWDPLLPIDIKNIKMGQHGSDTGVYDKEGKFDNEKFEKLFRQHAETDPMSWTHDEMISMIENNRKPLDFWGWLCAYAEWEGLFQLSRNKKDRLEKSIIKACYDGSLFEQIESRRKDKLSQQD